MKTNPTYRIAQLGRKAALQALHVRKASGEVVGRVKSLPALALSDVETLFETADANAIHELVAA